MKKIDGLRKSIKELDERESKVFEMLQSACAFLEEGNERMAKGVAEKNMNEIEVTQKIIELAQEKQKKAKHELETVQKEIYRRYYFKYDIIVLFHCSSIKHSFK